MRLWLLSCTAFLLVVLGAQTSHAQTSEPPPPPSPYPPIVPAVPAAGSGTPEATPRAASANPAGDGAAPGAPSGTGAAAPEPPPPLNPYPTNRGQAPRRWTSEDMARVRRMLEAERARRNLQIRHARFAPPPESTQGAPAEHGDAGAAFGLGLAIDAIYQDDTGFRLFDQHRASTRLGMWASHDLAALSKIAIVSGELGFGVEANDGQALSGSGELPMHLHSTTVHAALSVRWNLSSFLAPHVRVSGGVSTLDLEVTPAGSDKSETDSALSGFGAIGAGFLLHTPARLFENRRGQLASLKFGVMLEVGYALRSSVDFALNPEHSARNIPIVNADLGRLDLSGAYLRSSIVTRF